MHQGPAYLLSQSLFGPAVSKQTVRTKQLTEYQARELQDRLFRDAWSYFYSSLVSVADALNGLSHAYYTWATVKLYYSCFYSYRALLALDGYCLFYVKSSPFGIQATKGRSAESKKGQTHQVVLVEVGRRRGLTRLQGQTIDGEDPGVWLMGKREEANYRNAQFSEPLAPPHFELISKGGLHKYVDAYGADDQLIYTFDKGHAMLAYPIAVVRETEQRLCRRDTQNPYTREAVRYLRKQFVVDKRPVPSLLRIVDSVLQ
jgi:hypothetical protein